MSGAHSHGEGDPAAWAERAFRELALRGHRAGGARTAVIERLAGEGGCLTAQELAVDGGVLGTLAIR